MKKDKQKSTQNPSGSTESPKGVEASAVNEAKEKPESKSKAVPSQDTTNSLHVEVAHSPAEEESLLGKKLVADKEPSADEKPLAGEEPSADEKPSADEGSGAEKMSSTATVEQQSAASGVVGVHEGLDANAGRSERIDSLEGSSGSREKNEEGVATETRVEAPAPQKNKTPKTRFPWFVAILTLLLLLMMAVIAYLAWRGDRFISADQQKIEQIVDLRQQLQQQQQALEALAEKNAQVSSTFNATATQVNERLQAAEQRLAAQNKRLLAMSTITREDWLLAEAEYLLKLANQRVLIEKSAKGAEALVAEADIILRDLEDPDLFPLRKAVNNDLAALRLTKKVDVEGIYLAIHGLIVQLDKLPLQPTRQEIMSLDTELEAIGDQGLEPAGELPWWQSAAASFSNFMGGFKDYWRIRDHSSSAKALLAPDAAQYLQQNIRLMLERAQLALLREQAEIYQQSLQQAGDYIASYYPESELTVAYRQQLKQLSNNTIITPLPDISVSLELLHTYIENVHALQGAKPATGGSSQ